MKLQHYAIVFLIVILPFSIICRSKMTNYSLMLKDQVRLNNVIDSATQDALDMLVELNDEFQMLDLDERFDITQTLAEESVKSFFQTLAINFNMPYIHGTTENYFSMYVPAIVIVAYDGFFIYSVDDTPTGFSYQMSPKIPYAYFDEATGTLVHFTLGNYVTLYTNDNVYKGNLTCNYKEEALALYNEWSALTLQELSESTKEMSVLIEALIQESNGLGYSLVPNFLIPDSSGDSDTIPLLKDYDRLTDNQNTSETTVAVASKFHEIRRETIITLIRETLQQEINDHNTYASILGSTYDFALPQIANDEWTNSINDISVMSFIQGMKIGTNMYYDNYALSGSRITQTDYYYSTNETNKYYHHSTCSKVQSYFDGDPTSPVDNIFITREQAAGAGYFPCELCHP